MEKRIAEQIAKLINEQNQLEVSYKPQDIIEASENYVYIDENGFVEACAEIKKVQWYQCEICHVSVRTQRKGFGYKILKIAEAKAQQLHARIAQCTIRSTNVASIALFKKSSYMLTSSFRNARTGNEVQVFQKVL